MFYKFLHFVSELHFIYISIIELKKENSELLKNKGVEREL